MEDQKIRGDTPQKTDVKVNDEQLMDILLIMDKEEKSIKAVSKIDKDGNLKTVEPDKKNKTSFLDIDKNADLLENFYKNFTRQAKDPTRFTFFKVPFHALKESVLLFKELLKENRSQSVEKQAEGFRVDLSGINSAKQEKNNNQNVTEMAKQTNSPATATQQPVQGAETDNKNRFNESMINWPKLEEFGLSREFLKEKGLLDNMLKGYKSAQAVPISMNFGSAVLRTDARLSLQQSMRGEVVLAIHGIRKEPELDRPFFGHIFSDEDKKNLKESGNMGRVVELKNRQGEYVPSLISIDKITNEIVALKAENAFVPDDVKGVKLTDHEKNELREGKAVYIEGMTAASGKEFNAHIQINADRRGIEYLFENNKINNRQEIGGVKLSAKQQEDLNGGKAIFLEDMKRKDGELFSSFIKLDDATGKPSFTRYNPDSPEGTREIYIPKEIGGVQLTGEERKDLREGRPIFLDNMVNRKGEEFSSFIKADLETGKLSYSRTPDGFSQREQFKIPAEIFGVTLNVTQRAQLQDGKAVLVEGMKGFDGKAFNSYVKVNPNQAKLDYYNEDPDKKKASQRNANASENTNVQKTAEEKKSKKNTGLKV